MNKSSIHRWVPAVAGLAASCLLLLSLSAFGLWDPWEIEIAERARSAAPSAATAPQLGVWLVARSFQLLGTHEWSGRLPIALAGLAALALLHHMVAAYTDRRTAVYASVIAATSPLFIFNAVTMLGEAPSILLQTAIGWCALQALFAHSPGRRLAWLLGLIACGIVGVTACGALLCVLPPLCAAAVMALVDGPLRASGERRSGLGAWAIVAASALLLVAVTRAVLADAAGYSMWLGGAPIGGQPPSFDAVIERVFHAFAPWSALLPLALGRIMNREPASSTAAGAEQRLALFSVLWIAFGYAALTLFSSRYGQRAALVPLAPMAVGVALFLRDVERNHSAQWPAGIAATLLALLLLRDYALYPISPMHALPVADITLPEGFNPKRAWALALVPFCIALLFGFGHDPEQSERPAWTRPYRFLREQWQRGPGFRLWLLLLALLLLGLEIAGLVSFLPAVSQRLTTLGAKVLRYSMLLPVALLATIALLQLLTRGFGALRERRCLPLFITAAGIAGYAAFGFMPALSQQLSPRNVYDSYNQLAQQDEPLAEYGVKSRTAAYYAKGKPVEVDSLSGLVAHLATDERRWAVFPGEQLTEIDSVFRQRTRRHLFVADDRNARAVLVTNQPLAGRTDANRLRESVLFEPPAIESPLLVNFDDRLQLLGYKLELPHGDRVGQGEHFDITWYFRSQRALPGNYRVFVHIDGQGARIGGDHDPVEGSYPIRLWSPGDVIVDRQRIEVSATAQSGSYTIYMGIYSGDTRLPIKDGPHDPVDRAITGVLRIR